MSLELFITILVISATATSIAIEIIKTLFDKIGITYKTVPLATIVAFVVGVAEVIIYTLKVENEITNITVLYAVCMGIANLVGTQVGYDKIKEFIYTLFTKAK